MTFEEFKILAQKIEQSVRDPKLVEEILTIISKLSAEDINGQYKRAKKEDAMFLPKERLIEVAIKAYFNAAGTAAKHGEKLPETYVFDIITALIDKGADLTLFDSENQPVLHQAIYLQSSKQFINRYRDALHQLFAFAATKEATNFNIQNGYGDNLLIRSAKTRNFELIPWLHSEFDCDLNLPNKGLEDKIGLTVLDILDAVPSPDGLVSAIKNYITIKQGVSGKALSKETFDQLSKQMGRDNYNRIVRERKPPKSSDQVMNDIVSGLERLEKDPDSELSPIFSTLISLSGPDGKVAWARKEKVGSKEPDSKEPVTFSDKAQSTQAKPKPFSAIQNAVKMSCQLKKEATFQENVKDISKDQWLLLLNEAEKWRTNKNPSIQAFYPTFINYCVNLVVKKLKTNSEFPEELAKLVAEKLPPESTISDAASKP